MPGNIFHFFERQSKCEPSEGSVAKENIDKKNEKTRYDYLTAKNDKPNLAFIKRANHIYEALANDFYFDIFY